MPSTILDMKRGTALERNMTDMRYSFLRFLLESANIRAKWTKTDLTISQAAAHINTHCKGLKPLIADGRLLFRGDRATSPQLIDTTNSKRVSKDTRNLYQLMVDHQIAELGSAPRSTSLICSTNMATAASFGRVHLVFPYDHTKISFANKPDIFMMRVRHPIFDCTISDLDGILQRFLFLTGLTVEDGKSFESLDEIDAHLSKFSAIALAFLMLKTLDEFGIRNTLTDYDGGTIKFKDDHAKETFNAFAEAQTADEIWPVVKELEQLVNEMRISFSNSDLKTHEKIFSANKKFSALAETLFTPNSFPIEVKEVGKNLRSSDVKDQPARECWFTGKAVIIPGPAQDIRALLLELEKLGWEIGKAWLGNPPIIYKTI